MNTEFTAFNIIKLIWESTEDYIQRDQQIRHFWYDYDAGFFLKDSLCQWTGLRDKKGRKIYEGDIVKIPEGYGGDHHYPECIAIVKWDAPSFILWNIKNKHGMVGQEINSDWSDLEVIGNTLQNKELLE